MRSCHLIVACNKHIGWLTGLLAQHALQLNGKMLKGKALRSAKAHGGAVVLRALLCRRQMRMLAQVTSRMVHKYQLFLKEQAHRVRCKREGQLKGAAG